MTTPTLDRRLQQVAGFALLVSVCHAQSRATSLLSVSPSGAQGNGSSGTVATVLSADGRIVVFASQATNLVSGDTNGMPDVFLRDLQAGTIERVNLTSTGAEDNGGCGLPGGVSFDGRFVAFWSFGTNLVPSDTNGSTDVFVRDRQNGTTERVSVSSAGVEANGYSFSPSISGDGRYIAFESTAANLGAPVGGYGAFVHDRLTGTTEAIPSSLTLTNLGDGNLSISGDGRYLAYVAPEPFYANLPSIYVYDRQLQTSILASPGTETGNSPNNWCMYPALSADGRYVAFVSAATDLVGGDMNGSTIDVFVRDLQLHSTSIATVDSSGVQGNSDSFGHPQISPDG
jgi:Tol biopolymer transport system component